MANIHARINRVFNEPLSRKWLAVPGVAAIIFSSFAASILTMRQLLLLYLVVLTLIYGGSAALYATARWGFDPAFDTWERWHTRRRLKRWNEPAAQLRRIMQCPDIRFRRSLLRWMIQETAGADGLRQWLETTSTLAKSGEMHPHMGWYLMAEISMHMRAAWAKTDPECRRLRDIRDAIRVALPPGQENPPEWSPLHALYPRTAKGAQESREAGDALRKRVREFEINLMLTAGAIEMAVDFEGHEPAFAAKYATGELLWAGGPVKDAADETAIWLMTQPGQVPIVRASAAETMFLRLAAAAPLLLPLILIPVALLMGDRDPWWGGSIWESGYPPTLFMPGYIAAAVLFLVTSFQESTSASELRVVWAVGPIFYAAVATFIYLGTMENLVIAGLSADDISNHALFELGLYHLKLAAPYALLVLATDAILPRVRAGRARQGAPRPSESRAPVARR